MSGSPTDAPDWTTPVGRPGDVTAAVDLQTTERKTDQTVNDSFDTPISFDIADDEPRILEMAGILPDSFGTIFHVEVATTDSGGTPQTWDFAQYPNGMPLQFDPGIFLEEGTNTGVNVILRQESGASIDVDVSIRHRPVV